MNHLNGLCMGSMIVVESQRRIDWRVNGMENSGIYFTQTYKFVPRMRKREIRKWASGKKWTFLTTDIRHSIQIVVYLKMKFFKWDNIFRKISMVFFVRSFLFELNHSIGRENWGEKPHSYRYNEIYFFFYWVLFPLK